MIHYGDICQIKGDSVPLVDVVCGGSPCQDLSVAGKRAGLDGARSGLFMEQIRVIKEMRDEFTRQLRVRGTDVDRRLVKPRFMVWENVPGAFTSNKGEDFRVVLEETAKVVCEDAVIPKPPKGGGWTPSGCIVGDGWSIAWRVHDAQFWGVPQRRKRISLIADFGGQSAPEILFIRKGLPGDIDPCGAEEKDVAPDFERGVIASDKCSYGLDRASFNQGKNAQYDFSVDAELSPPIVAKGPGGDAEIIGPLCARDWKGVGTQYVRGKKVIVQSAVQLGRIPDSTNIDSKKCRGVSTDA